MRQSFKVVLSLGVVLSAAGCSDYLSGPGVDKDPNNVINLKRAGPLYVGIQAAGPPQREGQLARYAAMYTQQLAGVARQQQGFDIYGAKDSDIDTYFGAIYGSSNVLTGGGGLLDIHKLQQLGRAAHDSLYVGIGKVYEAMYIGLAADLFGDIPYRQAADSTNLHPAFDPQLQVYGDLQAQLDSAITIFLAAPGPSNQGPAADGTELIYKGRTAAGLRAVYIAVAHSLKARLYMHTAEVTPGAYALALAQVPLGISAPADDFLWFHDLTATGTNIWWQFNSARTGDLAAGAALVEIEKRRIAAGVEDTLRLSTYFTRAKSGSFLGARPGGTTNMPTNGVIYNGNGDPADGSFSSFGPSFDGATAAASGFRQPEITFAETQLIGAEAAFQTGGAGAAQPFLNAERANRTYGTLVFAPAPGVLAATLQNIMEEKSAALFLNPEVWNDYKRTCLPSLAPAPANTASGAPPRATPIPGRLPYGLSEENANPNVPKTNSAGMPVTSTGQNPNDPNPCPVLNYVSSTPLAN